VSIQDDVIARSDPKLLDILLDNLFDNAFKFTAKQTNPQIEFGAMKQGEEDVFYIRDNGSGFNMEWSIDPFQAFARLHSKDEFKGIGIGLSTVKRVVRLHNGRVWVNSKTGAGTTLYFTLKEPSDKPKMAE